MGFESFFKEDISHTLATAASRQQALPSALRHRGSSYSRPSEDRQRDRHERPRSRSGRGPAAATPLGGAHQGEGPPVVGEVVDVEDKTVPCLGQYVTAWRRVTSQPFVLQAVLGYSLDFVRIQPLLTLGPARGLTGSTRPSLKDAIMGEEVESLLEKGAMGKFTKTLQVSTLSFSWSQKRRGGAETCDQPETTKRIHQEETISRDNS